MGYISYPRSAGERLDQQRVQGILRLIEALSGIATLSTLSDILSLINLIDWHNLPPHIKAKLLALLRNELYSKLDPQVTQVPQEQQSYRRNIQALNSKMVEIGLSLVANTSSPLHERLNSTGVFDFRVAQSRAFRADLTQLLIDSSGLILTVVNSDQEAIENKGAALINAIHEHPYDAGVLHESYISGKNSTFNSCVLDGVTELLPGSRGSWNKALNKQLMSNHKYRVGNHLYETDEAGRVNRVSGELNLITRDRNTYQQRKSGKEEGIKDGLVDDDGGHLVASIFDGAGEQINYAPMNSNLNRSAWKKMENTWAEAIKGPPPKEVKIDIQAIYDDGDKRPSKFLVKYTIDGEPFKSRFKNKPGG